MLETGPDSSVTYFASHIVRHTHSAFMKMCLPFRRAQPDHAIDFDTRQRFGKESRDDILERLLRGRRQRPFYSKVNSWGI
jgi:hypothetical protein